MMMMRKTLLALSLALPGLSAWAQPATACLPAPGVNENDCYIEVIVSAPQNANRCVVMLADPKVVEVLVHKNTGIDMYWKLTDNSYTGGYKFRPTASGKAVVFKSSTNNNFQMYERKDDLWVKWHNANLQVPKLYEYAVKVSGPKNCTLDPWIKNQ